MADVAKLEKKIAELEKKIQKLMGMEDDFTSKTTENLQEMLVKLDEAAKVEEKILSLIGSTHKVKRRGIKIKSVKESTGEESR